MAHVAQADRNLVFVELFLSTHKYYELIAKKWLSIRAKSKAAREYEEALGWAKWALHDQARSYIREAREHGQLLFCFEGTTVLKGGAA